MSDNNFVPNRLSNETSPYLLQHAANPVDWYPWGNEALQRAKEEDKPILLSVGYSACHWCHVMEHESFEDDQTAAYLNQHFVPIKVDREERPDIDAVYMDAVQAMTGRGGWPLTVFLDTDAAPFFGGTYFPPESGAGSPSFTEIMKAVVDAWQNNRLRLESSAEEGLRKLRDLSSTSPSAEIVSPSDLSQAQFRLHDAFDSVNGGFGGAPKFPMASALEFLLRRYVASHDDSALPIVSRTLTAMANGGIHDQLGGGFARYSVDARWQVPHFEKMLYDNAQLARVYLHGWQVTKIPYFREVCEMTLDWAIREMRGPEGGFYSSIDADSEGQEGKFYVWEQGELKKLLGALFEPIACYWGVSSEGNFDRKNILYIADRTAAKPSQVEKARQILLEVRSKRVRPGTDEKRITSWNALMVTALAEAGAIFKRSDYIDASRECAEFLVGTMSDGEGGLLRTFKGQRAHIAGYLEDHAHTVEALLALYQSTFEPRWFEHARSLADTMVERFHDSDIGGFFTTSADQEKLIVRRKDIHDHPIPSGNSSAAIGLLTLAKMTGETDYEKRAIEVFRLFHTTAARNSEMFSHLLSAMDFHFADVKEVALAGDNLKPMLEIVRSSYRPNIVIAADEPSADRGKTAIALLKNRTPVDSQATAYICEDFTCQSPITDLEEFKSSI